MWTLRRPMNKSLMLTLCMGVTFGFSFAYMVLALSYTAPPKDYYARHLLLDSVNLDTILQSGPHDHGEHEHEPRHPIDNVLKGHEPSEVAHEAADAAVPFRERETTLAPGGDAVAQELSSRVRVLCWIMTQPSNHAKKAIHVKATWGKRCNKLVFMSSQEDPDLPAIGLDVEEGRNFLWAKTKQAFKYVYDHYFDEADWFYKADDDTYAIMENMRMMLEPYSPKMPIFFGCRFKPFAKQGYMSGGAGYVLSKEALYRFATQGLPDPKKCKKDHGGAEDVEMGKCLENVGVRAGDSRDSEGRYRFFPFTPESHLISEKYPASYWYWKYVFYPQKLGMDCCSDSAISFHYVPPNLMYTIEYLVYHLKPYGVHTRLEALPPPDHSAIPAGANFSREALDNPAYVDPEPTTAPPPTTAEPTTEPTTTPTPAVNATLKDTGPTNVLKLVEDLGKLSPEALTTVLAGIEDLRRTTTAANRIAVNATDADGKTTPAGENKDADEKSKGLDAKPEQTTAKSTEAKASEGTPEKDKPATRSRRSAGGSRPIVRRRGLSSAKTESAVNAPESAAEAAAPRPAQSTVEPAVAKEEARLAIETAPPPKRAERPAGSAQAVNARAAGLTTGTDRAEAPAHRSSSPAAGTSHTRQPQDSGNVGS